MSMNLHTLKASPGARTRRVRVGRGESSGLGKTSGRGHKGQYQRKGHKHKAGFEGGQMPLIRRIPKRGFQNPNPKVFAPVNVAALERFDTGAEITPEGLRAAGLVNGRWDGIKLLGGGDLTRALQVRAHAFSASARAKIEAAGGSCQVVEA